jgi:hypothetical protein
MLLIRDLKKGKTAIHGHAVAGMTFQTVALPDVQKWLMLKQQPLQDLERLLPQCHVEVSGSSTDQAHFVQLLEVKPERLERCWKKLVLFAELVMKKGHS